MSSTESNCKSINNNDAHLQQQQHITSELELDHGVNINNNTSADESERGKSTTFATAHVVEPNPTTNTTQTASERGRRDFPNVDRVAPREERESELSSDLGSFPNSGSECQNNNQAGAVSSVISGVEHVFFEDELEKMEHQNNVIVLAVDGGVHAEMAFRFYKENVDRPGYQLHVLHHSEVWSHIRHEDGSGPSADHCKEIAEKIKGVTDVVEEKYKKLMEENNIKGEFITLHGRDAWHDIVQYQEQSKAMMIVMGTRGSGAFSRTFRGSVSDSVVHHAHVPVLVCCHPKD